MTRLHRLGEHALLVDVDSTDEALALATWCRERWQRPDDAGLVGEVVAGAATVLLDEVIEPEQVRSLLEAQLLVGVPKPAQAQDTPPLLLPVVFDGPDLADVATLWGCSETEVVDRLCALCFTSVFCGFAPGFAYLTGLPAQWAVPRRLDPRARVPAGSVALADAWCGVYPRSSPGGWQLIGRTDAVLWDLTNPNPALLTPGVRVRFSPR